MKKFMFLLALATQVAVASELPKCDIATLKDAQTCMDKVASEHVEYNLPNIGSASTQKQLLEKVLKSTGRKNLKVDADYVGVMLEKGDEWYLYYYALKQGKSQQVVEVDSINLVDITDELTSPLTVKDLILGDRNKKFDTEDRGWIQDYLDLE